MVRNYKRKGMTQKWKEEDLRRAIEFARTHKNVRLAGQEFGIPQSTLRDHMKIANKSMKHGHPTVLTSEQEQEIVDIYLLFAQWGFGLGRQEVTAILENYFKVTKKQNPFRNGAPGEGWWTAFIRQHPQLTKCKPQNLQM